MVLCGVVAAARGPLCVQVQATARLSGLLHLRSEDHYCRFYGDGKELGRISSIRTPLRQ
jgi:hypothetical protein